MRTKYNTEISSATLAADVKRLINQLWKLIPMRENGENWQEHLSVIAEEIAGMNEVFANELQLLVLLCKLEGLTSEICNEFFVYRKTVFKCIDLLTKAVNVND